MSVAVVERIERARGELAEGKLGYAVGTLGDVVRATRDRELLDQMQTLAEEGLARSGRFGKRPWQSLLKDIAKQLANG